MSSYLLLIDNKMRSSTSSMEDVDVDIFGGEEINTSKHEENYYYD